MYLKNIFSESGASVVGALGLLLTQLVLVRVLSDNVFSSFLLASAIIGIAEVFADFGVRIVGMKAFAVEKDTSGLFSAITISKLGNGIVLFAILLFWPQNKLDLMHLLVVLGISATQVSTDPFIWFFRGKERMDISALLILFWRLANTGILILAAYFGANLIQLLLFWLTNNILRILLAHIIVRKWFEPEFHIRLNRQWLNDALSLSRAALPIGFAFLSIALYLRMGILLLSRVASDQDVAIYGVAYTLVASSGFIATAISNATFPRIARAINDENWQEATRHINHNIHLILLVFVPLCMIGIMLAPWVVWLLYPPKVAMASNVIILLLPGLLLSNVNFALKMFMNAAGKNWFEFSTVLLGIVVFLLLFFLPWNLPISEMAGIAWSLSEFSIFLAKIGILLLDKRFSGLFILTGLGSFLLLAVVSFVRLYA